MSIEVLDSLYELEPLRERWNQLAENSPLLSWEWLVSWWETHERGNRLAVIICTDDNAKLVGIAPWFIDDDSVGNIVRTLGSGKACMDYTRILAAPGHEQYVYHSIASFLLEAIKGNRDFRFIGAHGVELDGVDENAAWYGDFSKTFTQNDFKINTRHIECSWRVSLTDGWDGLLRSMSGNWRRKARKAARRIESGEVTFHSAIDQDSFFQAFDQFVEIHQRRRKMLNEHGCFADPQFELFLRIASEALLKRNACRIQWCEHDSQMIAAQYQLLDESTVYMYQSGMHPDAMDMEPGHTILAGAIQSAIADGKATYDFLRGDEPYKAGWQGQPVPLTKVRLVSPILSARISDAVSSTARRAKDTVRAWWQA